MKNYIGMDLHSKSCTLVVMTKDGEITKESQIPTSELNLTNFLAEVDGPKALMFEETGLAQWAWDVTKDKVNRLVVCNPTYLPKKSGPKNDYRDALHLCTQLRAGNFTEVHHEKSLLMDLRTVMRHYSNLVIRLVILKNSFKAVLRNEGVSTQSKWVTSRNKEKCLEIKNPLKRKVAEALFEEMNSLEMMKQKLESEFKQNYFSVPIVKNLMTIPGIGPVRAHVIAAFICSPHRFENKHKLWAYAKLVNHADESDGKLISNRSPHGRSELKEAFVGAAVRVIAYSGESALKNYYNDLIDNKKLDARKARNALARKIAAICLGIMKSGDNFNESMISLKK